MSGEVTELLDQFEINGWLLAELEPELASERYVDIDCVRIFPDARRIVCLMPDAAIESRLHTLVDHVLPKLLAFDGHLVLHAGLVETPCGAIGFAGPSGHGKSTLTASLYRRGLPLMGDDANLISPDPDGWRAKRLYPSLRLFPDSLGLLFRGAGETAPVANDTDKRNVHFVAGPESAPMTALFRLTHPTDDICITRLTPAEACIAIIANAFALDPIEPEETKRRFAQAAAAARSIPVYDLHYPRSYAALPKVHAAIFDTVGLTLPLDQPA